MGLLRKTLAMGLLRKTLAMGLLRKTLAMGLLKSLMTVSSRPYLCNSRPGQSRRCKIQGLPIPRRYSSIKIGLLAVPLAALAAPAAAAAPAHYGTVSVFAGGPIGAEFKKQDDIGDSTAYNETMALYHCSRSSVTSPA